MPNSKAVRSACEEQCDADGMAVIPDAPAEFPSWPEFRTSDVDGNGEVDVLDRVELPYVDTWTHGIWLTTPAWGGESCADIECAEGSLCYQGVCVPEHTGFASFVAITEQSYASIPLVAGVGAGIEGSDDLLDGQGRGAIAGSVYDCSEGDGILGAAIGTTAVDRQTKVAYFTGDLPSPVLRSTDGDGVFAILSHAAGQTTLAAVMHKQWCTDAVDCACGGLSAEGPADCTDQACLEAQMDGKTNGTDSHWFQSNLHLPRLRDRCQCATRLDETSQPNLHCPSGGNPGLPGNGYPDGDAGPTPQRQGLNLI